MFAATIGKDHITIVIDNKTYNIDGANSNFKMLAHAIRDNDESLIRKTVDLATAIKTYARGLVDVTESAVFYKGVPLNNGLTSHILWMMRDGFDVKPMIKFLEKMMENPSFNSREQLFRFVEANKITVHPDGDMILYKNANKRPNGDFVDIHSGTYRNNVGDKPSITRPQVDDNPNNLCSYGLHVCALAYLKSFPGAATLLVKVNPKDVVSVPVDHQDTKMRVVTYEVIGIHDKGYDTENTDKPVYGDSSYEEEFAEDPYQDEYDYDESDRYDDSHDEYMEGYNAGFDDGVESAKY